MARAQSVFCVYLVSQRSEGGGELRWPLSFDYLTYSPPYVPPPQHGVRRVAMQHVGRPKALNLTEVVSQKSEHVIRRQISIVERDLRLI